MARGITGFPRHLLPFPSEVTFDIFGDSSIDDVGDKLDAELSTLPIQWHWRKHVTMGVGFARENVWSRQARRKNIGRKAANVDDSTGNDDLALDEDHAALGFKVQLSLVEQQEQTNRVVHVTVRWLKGVDTVLFESFCGMLKRKLEGR